MSKSNYIDYIHHDGVSVAVRADLKGKHREYCLCYKCPKFKPGQEDNCRMAALLYALCRQLQLVTPVFECPDFPIPE